jgi:TIR domain/PAN domain
VTDIFFSYSSADRERVRPVRDALVAQGFEVFWDQEVPTGLDWDSWIRQHLAKCKCAMAFWSAASVASDNVRHEAVVAKQQGKLISVLLESLTAQQFPMGLYAQQAANLAGWDGDTNHTEWRKLRREFEAKLTPGWVRQHIDELEAELVGERARREGAERRDRILQAQIAKEAETQQDLKRERDGALDEGAALKATVQELTRARADADARQAEAQQGLKRERDKALEELTQARSDAEAREAEAQQDLKRERDEVTALKATLEEVTRARSESEGQVVELSQRLSEANAQVSASVRRIKVANSAARAALFARGPVMRFGSIAAAVATVAFWTYHLLWPASQPLPPTTSESAAVQQSAPANAKETASVQQTVPTNTSGPPSVQQAAPQAGPAQQATPQPPAQQAAALPAGQPISTSSRFEINRNTVVIGSHFSSRRVGSIGECEAVCKENGACQLFSFSKAVDYMKTNGCFLYRDSTARMSPNEGYDSGIRR